MNKKLVWHKVLEDKSELPEGRIMTVTAGQKQVALSHFEGKFCALDNRCPHQGGPLVGITIRAAVKHLALMMVLNLMR